MQDGKSTPLSNECIISDVVFFDCEATGLDAAANELIEVGLVSGRGKLLMSQRAKPSRSVPARITELTGIRDLDLADEPPESVLLAKIHPVLESARALGGYFLHLDIEYLRCAYARAGRQGEFLAIAQKPRICAKTLARLIVPEIGLDFSLPDLCKYLGVAALSNHRAADDALMSLQVVNALVARSPVQTFEQLISFQGQIVESPWEIPASSSEQVMAARQRWRNFVASTVEVG